MVRNSSKAKSKHPPKAKTKTRKPNAKPLLAAAAVVRRVKPAPRALARPAAQGPSITHPAFLMINLMGRVMTEYAELPIRLTQCRSPMDLWLEQARFAQRIFSHSIRN